MSENNDRIKVPGASEEELKEAIRCFAKSVENATESRTLKIAKENGQSFETIQEFKDAGKTVSFDYKDIGEIFNASSEAMQTSCTCSAATETFNKLSKRDKKLIFEAIMEVKMKEGKELSYVKLDL